MDLRIAEPFLMSPPSEVVLSAVDVCDSSADPLVFSMNPQQPLSAASLPPATPEAAAGAEARPLAKRRSSAAPGVCCASDAATTSPTASRIAAEHLHRASPDPMTGSLRGSILSQPYCISALAEEEEAASRALAKRRSLARDPHLRDSLLALHDAYRRLSTADLAAAVDATAVDPCAFRNLHFDEPPCAETASTTSAATASRRSSRAGAASPDGLLLGGSRRGSCCHSGHDVIANRRRVSCFTEGAATPAMYQCNGTRCGESHHCPEAFDDPCCGAAAEDFWVQAYYKEERRKRNKRAKAAARAAKGKAVAAGGRRASRVPTSKRGSGALGDLEASKEVVSAADKKRRWVVYICATFVVMLVALAVLMVVVSLSMGNRGKVKANGVSEAAAAAAADALTLSPLETETSE